MTPWAKRLAIALSISVAVNLLLAGFLIGRGFRSPRSRDHGAMAGPTGAWSGKRPPAFRAALERQREPLRTSREGIERARSAARESLTRESFDARAFEQALSALRAETAKGQELLHRSLGEAAAAADREERRALARMLSEGGPERRPRKRREP